MTTLLEERTTQERAPERLMEPPVPKAPLPKQQATAPKPMGRWIRWMVGMVVLAVAASLTYVAVRDGDTEVAVLTHQDPGAVVGAAYVSDTATVLTHPLTEVYEGR